MAIGDVDFDSGVHDTRSSEVHHEFERGESKRIGRVDHAYPTWVPAPRVARRALTIEGQPLAWGKTQILLLGRDGALYDFNPADAKKSKKTGKSFVPYTIAEMQAALRAEFDRRYDLSTTAHFVVAHPRGGGREWADRLETLYRGFSHYMSVRGFPTTEPAVPLAAIVFRQDIVKSWDLESGELIVESKHNEVFGEAYSPDGQTLATVGWDSTIRLWDAATGKLRLEQKVKPIGDVEQQNGIVFRDNDMRMYDVAYSPWDGTLATTHMNNELRIWKADDLTLISARNAGGGFAQGNLQFSPDGQWLTAGMSNGIVPIWDALQPMPVVVIGKYEDSVNVVAFNGDGSRLVTGGDDGVGYLWDVRPAADNPLHNQSLDELWSILISDDAHQSVYGAFWELAAKSDVALPMIADRLRAVDSLLDPNESEASADDAEQTHTQRLKRLVLAKDESVLSPAAAHRAMALLRHIDTPESRALLEELAAKNPGGELARLAADALK